MIQPLLSLLHNSCVNQLDMGNPTLYFALLILTTVLQCIVKILIALLDVLMPLFFQGSVLLDLLEPLLSRLPVYLHPRRLLLSQVAIAVKFLITQTRLVDSVFHSLAQSLMFLSVYVRLIVPQPLG